MLRVEPGQCIVRVRRRDTVLQTAESLVRGWKREIPSRSWRIKISITKSRCGLAAALINLEPFRHVRGDGEVWSMVDEMSDSAAEVGSGGGVAHPER